MYRAFVVLCCVFILLFSLPLASQIPAALRSLDNKAQYLVIAHPQFVPALRTFIDWRTAKGFSMRLVTTADIYAEFSDNGALKAQEALRSFVNFTLEHWQKPAPQYILLVGSTDLVPSYRVKVTDPLFTLPEYLRLEDSVSLDELFVVATQPGATDTRPLAAIGRFPARDKESLHNMIDKTIKFEDYARWMGYKTDIVGISDSTDATAFESDLRDLFKYGNLYQAKYQHRSLNVRELHYRRSSEQYASRADVFRAVNAGTFFFTYYGHGAPDIWSSGRILTTGDVDTVFSKNSNPFIMMSVGCSQNFDLPNKTSIVERLMSGKAGAVMTFASSGLGHLPQGSGMLKSVTAFLLENIEHLSFGQAVLKAKQFQYYPYKQPDDFVYRRFTILGDPALRLPAQTLTSVQQHYSAGAEHVKVSPQPASQYVELQYTLRERSSVLLRLTSLRGETMLTRELPVQEVGSLILPLDLNGFAAGVYHYTIQANGKSLGGIIRVSP